ncbi:hypothetical protein LSM04_007281 [Trypanosoma melophagium]|uniref:uncharacterized protein n=1 Tax=Trypanosoma melophagium TaxID=715481 RepID=UPI003519DE47|nr:hypothetical protein LSM04_007281 [Trypanosoma melophagium]
MPLCVNLSFNGYDRKKKAVLLKGPFAALYFLLPKWSGDRPTEESVETDEESEFMGSSCSESYVSSASTYSGSSINEKNSIITSDRGIYDEGTEKEMTLEGGNRELNVDGIENAALPLHGSVLRLRDEYRNKNKEELPFYTVRADSDKDYRMENYFTSIFLGYDEHKNVFLLPTPHLNSENGLCAFRFSPILQISFTEMCQYYSWDYKTSINEYGNISISFNLPLGKDYMNSPILDQAALQNVFGVSTNKVYYLSLWSAYVQFVGVAWGLPWVIQLPCDGANNGSPSAAKESNDPLCIEPLLYCYGERPLCEIYGLYESQKDISIPYPALPHSLHSDDAVNRGEKQKSFCKQPENQLEKKEKEDGVNTVSTTGSFALHEEFFPRGTNYRAQLNTRDGIITMSTPGFFLRGDKLICCGSFGVTQDCDTSPEVLARFGVLHGDYLKGKTGRIFEGREAMVLGVHMGSLVVLLDNDVRTTTLRNVQGKNDLQVLFSGVDDLHCTPKGEAVESVGENQEVTALSPIENVSEGEHNDDNKAKNDDVDEKEKKEEDDGENCSPTEEKPNEGAGVKVEEEEEGVEFPSTRVPEIPSDKIPVCETEESDLGERGMTPKVFLDAGSGSDADGAVDVRSESGMKETDPSPPLCVDESGTPATTDREDSGEHQERTALRFDEHVRENQEVTALSPIENVSEGEHSDDNKAKNDDVDEKEKKEEDDGENCSPTEEKPNEGAGVKVEMVEGHTVENQSELEVDIQRTESCEFSHSFVFTDFLKAVAYWKMGIFSAEEQREQPLAFLKYYEINTQQRMMEAVELFRKYKNMFPALDHYNSSMSASDNKECKFDTSVYHVVQLLNQNGGIQVL